MVILWSSVAPVVLRERNVVVNGLRIVEDRAVEVQRRVVEPDNSGFDVFDS